MLCLRLIVIFFTCYSHLVLGANNHILNNDEHPASKSEYSFGVIPTLAFDADQGINYGGVINLFDHGTTQWGCALAMDDFAHRLYQFRNNKLGLKDDKPFLKGQIASVHCNVIHMMGNSSNENALSIHNYGTKEPGIKVAHQSRVFYPEINRMVYTQGAAHLFNPKLHINEMIAFENIKERTRNDYFALINSNRASFHIFNIPAIGKPFGNHSFLLGIWTSKFKKNLCLIYP